MLVERLAARGASNGVVGRNRHVFSELYLRKHAFYLVVYKDVDAPSRIIPWRNPLSGAPVPLRCNAIEASEDKHRPLPEKGRNQ